MSRLDDIKARAEAGMSKDEILLRGSVGGHFAKTLLTARIESVLDDLAAARSDVPLLLAVAEAAVAAVVSATTSVKVHDDNWRSLVHAMTDERWNDLRAALAPLLEERKTA